jgi:acetate kinase
MGSRLSVNGALVRDSLPTTDKGEIGVDGSRVKVFVIPTDEEFLIARDTVRCARDSPRRW